MALVVERKKLKILFLDLFVDRVHLSYKFFFFSFPSSSFKECIVIPVHNHPTSLGKRERQGDAPCTPTGEIP